MGWHIIKRLLQAVPVLLGIATITFFIIHLAPGDLWKCLSIPIFVRTKPCTDAPKNGPIFTKKFIQPGYNPKARYLPIRQKYRFRKYCIISSLQKSQNLRTDSMSAALP
jgi:ABC-type dipeptide/oligopeptide/nickel transport system permease component